MSLEASRDAAASRKYNRCVIDTSEVDRKDNRCCSNNSYINDLEYFTDEIKRLNRLTFKQFGFIQA